MMGRFHGVLSLLLIAAAQILGLAVTWHHSRQAGAAHGALLAASIPIILYAYCAKCRIRKSGCRHVLPGLLTGLLPERSAESYYAMDYAGVVLPSIALTAVAQPFLWRTPVLMAAYWALLFTGLVEIRLRVCRNCGNRCCPLRKQVG